MNIDWSKAPEGATHWTPATGVVCPFLKFDGRWFWFGFGESWIEFRYGTEWVEKQLSGVIPRPGVCATEPWSGEGLPPVGTVCNWREKLGSQWVEATVLFITDSSVVLRREDGFEWQMLTKSILLRPLKSAEQIAAEERENALKEMIHTISLLDTKWSHRACSALYDAGYRKQEPSQ